ncbi:putative ABC transporter-binding protein precursor [Peptococcaceae bacterium CEB3]|nr:putative ABC transporter-binding protein precursor [Peptococcaceae bacterium CEB3]
MKLKWKKVLSVAILPVLMLSLAGCGGANTDSSASTAKQVTIHVACQEHPDVDALKELLPSFEKQYGVKVDLNVLPQQQLNTKVEIALASNSSDYDVIMMDDMQTAQYAKAGWIVPLDTFINNTSLTNKSKFNESDFLKGFLKVLAVNGTQYALPFYGESTMLFYNKEMFSKAGISAPPQNMQELEADAAKLTGNGVYGIALRGSRDINWYPWAGFLFAFGGHWLDANGKPTLNSPAAVQATQLYGKLISKYGPPGGASFDWNQVQLSMQQGKAAMIIDASNFGPRLEDPKESKIVGKVGFAMVPAGPAGRFPSVYTAGLAIPKGSKHQADAWKFIEWATSKQTQLESAMKVSRADVTRQSVWEDPAYTQKYNNKDMMQIAVKSMNLANPDYLPRIPQFNKLSSIVGIAVSKVIAGTNAQTAMNQAQDAAIQLFK